VGDMYRPPAGLLSVAVEMNQSDLSSAGAMNQLVERDDGHTVEMLVELASDPSAMAASEAFLELWQTFESEVIAAQAAAGSVALEPLRDLLGMLPVGHVDEASAFRLDSDMPLLELCAFSVVAASVEMNFPDAASWVSEARAVLNQPAPEQRARFTGSEADLDELFGWIDAGKPSEAVRRGPTSHDSPDHDTSLHEWLEMMAKEHVCDSRGRPSLVPLEDAGLDEDDNANMNQDDESSITVQGGSPFVSSSGDEESVFSSTATEIDACLEEWVTTDAAKMLMEFLERALPRE